MTEFSAEQKETARQYLRRAFSSRSGKWFTMEEIKSFQPTHHGIRALCTRGDEAIRDGELINRFRPGKNYKEWAWLGFDKPDFFFFKFRNETSPAYLSYCEMESSARNILWTPADEVELFRGSVEAPVLMGKLCLAPDELIDLGYTLCPACKGVGEKDDACVFCSGSGWTKKEK